MILTSVNSGHLSQEVIQTKAAIIGTLLASECRASLSVVRAAASLSREGYLTRVENMFLENINLANVPHAACLGDIQVDDIVWIDKLQGDIGSIVAKIKCSTLLISNMQLSVGATQALVSGMSASVETVRLGYIGSVEVDMEALATYDGRGQCSLVSLVGERYRAEVRRWAQRIQWKVEIDDCDGICIGIGIEELYA